MNKSVESGTIDYNEKRQYLISRGANFFVHFTSVKNIESILKYGLLSINKLQEMNLIKDTIRNDLTRYDKRNDTISLSIAFPNYMYFYKVRKNKWDSTWVVLLINIVNLDFKKMSFCKDNAATTKEVNDMKSKYLLSDLKELLTDYDRRRTRSNLEIPDNYTTNPQSEVLYRGEISSFSMKNICFKTKAERDNFVESNKHLKPEFLKKCIVKSEYFNPRLDYEWWRSNG
ncbi:DarT ssDNA thymidine ADP-ribosyltransferase family protein [Erysipelothrix rhusiopathiae]|uniref:DarT ssDNA thymidine ADP-ribosyltransferase family protein n=1 Tax=Erysipelothrix rhusiopathiae TaxID=1648 RepID=UPI002B253E0A|nr:DarT ssDNA thymidine ADP-ribosyltransferase family protein [Erysipelothrix rhusiopathiae]WRB93601.1 DarT ssDNA thymidine ADP-ribosyltransferase family protein [Erysipelothrix rhusiopathiae]